MKYVGLDIHDKNTIVQFMDANGCLSISETVATDRACFGAFFDELDESVSVTLEAGRNWWWISQFLHTHPNVAQLKVLDPRRSRKIAEELSVLCGYGRAKNDRIDAEMMAHEDRRGLAPAIRLPDEQQLVQRTLMRYRFELVQQKTALSSRLQGLFAFHGIHLSTNQLLENEISLFPCLQLLPEMLRFILKEWVIQSRLYQKQILRCERKLNRRLPQKDPDIQRLMTAPGIGIVLARIIISEVFTIERFPAPKYLISYAGLAPVEQESAGKKGIVRLNQHCNYYLKYAFITAAHAARHHHKYRRKYNQDVKKHGY